MTKKKVLRVFSGMDTYILDSDAENLIVKTLGGMKTEVIPFSSIGKVMYFPSVRGGGYRSGPSSLQLKIWHDSKSTVLSFPSVGKYPIFMGALKDAVGENKIVHYSLKDDMKENRLKDITIFLFIILVIIFFNNITLLLISLFVLIISYFFLKSHNIVIK